MIVSTKNMFPKIRTFVCHVFGTFSYFFHVSMKHKFMNYKTPAKTKQIYV